MTTIETTSRSYVDHSSRDELVSATQNRTPDPRVSKQASTAPAPLPEHYGDGAAVQATAAKDDTMPPLSPEACKLLPDAALDHQARALSGRLAAPADYADRERDAAELKNVEGELQARESTKKAAAQEAHGGVLLCKRPADLPGKEIHGAEHWWLETARKSAGMGPATGNVPGHGELLPETWDTKLIDHSHEPRMACAPVKGGIDEDCVDRELVIGAPTGTWIPGLNDCHTVVKAVIDKCHQEAVDKVMQ
jgi:hypothetical protein